MSTKRRSRPAAAAAPISMPRPTSRSITAIISCCRATVTRCDYARSIGTEAGLVGPKRAQFPFVDLATGQRWRSISATAGCRAGCSTRARRVPDTGLLDYLAAGAADLGRRRQAGRQRDPLRRHAVSAPGAAAVARGAQCRSAGGLGRACRRHRAGNAACGRPGLPSADRARRPELGPDRACRQAAAGQGRRASASATSCAAFVRPRAIASAN